MLRKMRRAMVRSALAVAGLTVGVATSLAAGTANTNVTNIVDDAKATFDYALPICLIVAAMFILWAIGKRVIKRFTAG